MVVGLLKRVLFITLTHVLPPPVLVLLQTVPGAVLLQPAPAPVLHALEAATVVAVPVVLPARQERAAVLLEQEQQLLAQAR
jgi:hypothetical protein